MNYESAVVMGQDTGTDIVSALNNAANLSKELRAMAYSIVSKGPDVFTPNRATVLQSLFEAWRTAMENLAVNYPDVDYSKIDPTAAATLDRDAPVIIKYITEIGKYDPSIGQVGAAIRYEIRNAISTGDLDHPLIPTATKTGILNQAYGPQSDAKSFQIYRDKYNRDGTLKSGGAGDQVTRAQALKNIELLFSKAGVERQVVPTQPAITQTERETADATSQGIPAGLIAAGAAAIVAFFALRG